MRLRRNGWQVPVGRIRFPSPHQSTNNLGDVKTWNRKPRHRFLYNLADARLDENVTFLIGDLVSLPKLFYHTPTKD